MRKNVVDPDRSQMRVWRMLIARWTPKAANTHSQYIINISFPLKRTRPCFRLYARCLSC